MEQDTFANASSPVGLGSGVTNLSPAIGLPQDFLLPTPWNSCNDLFQEATTCQTSRGYEDFSSMKEYKFDNSGGQTSGGSNMFDDEELDAEFNHGYAYSFG